MLVQELRRIQDRHGYLPKQELIRLSELTGTPLYRLQEVASFFPHFRLTPPAQVEVLVCRDMSCALRGSRQLLTELQKFARGSQPTELRVQGTSCLGRCDRAPAVRIECCRSNPSSVDTESHSESHRERNYLTKNLSQLKSILQQSMEGTPPHGDDDTSYVPHGLA
ncbi:MAG: hypothetical protein FJ267_07740, partial [Planctomycetes bacterium]|nr:hypothetical protein [Planctomycetota bacterium]